MRLRWSDPEPEDPATPLHWRYAAWILASLFLNLQFWLFVAMEFPIHRPITLYVAGLAVASCLVAILFFAGPALLVQAAGQSLSSILETAFGSLPAQILRAMSALFLALWIASLIALVSAALSYLGLPTPATCVVLAAILAYLLASGAQSLRTNAMLARFVDKLAIAILIAAFIRVRSGWLGIETGFPLMRGDNSLPPWWGISAYTISSLCSYTAPLALLAADFSRHSSGRKQLALTGLSIAVPLFLTLLFVSMIGVATWASPYYQPSLQPTVYMALFSKTAGSAVPWRMLLVEITIFGAARFGARMLSDFLSFRSMPLRWRGLPLACAGGAILWLSFQGFAPGFFVSLTQSARCLAIVAAVLTADAITGKRRAIPASKFNLAGTIALLAGLALPLYLPRLADGGADHGWLLPSYAAAFLTRLLLRFIPLSQARTSTTLS